MENRRDFYVPHFFGEKFHASQWKKPMEHRSDSKASKTEKTVDKVQPGVARGGKTHPCHP